MLRERLQERLEGPQGLFQSITPGSSPGRSRRRNDRADASDAASYFDEIRSTSNTSVAFGGITPPAPRAP